MMQNIDRLTVLYENRVVGYLAKTYNGLYPFEYADTWLAEGFAISPLTLPLEKRLFMPKQNPLGGMFGVFNDSLPDGWGHVLVDRMLRAHKENPDDADGLARLALVGNSGMGALCYEPIHTWQEDATGRSDLDFLAVECSKLLDDKPIDDLDSLFRLGGSSGGARPKILTSVNGEEWMIKFPSHYDPHNIGEQEYLYTLCAQQCGITIPEVRLFPSQLCSGYFGARRFDRDSQGHRIHVISASGLLETSHQLPNLDYRTLMALSFKLTKSMDDSRQLFRRMCFNVFAHNRDDHSKNFSFLYDDKTKSWQLSPAYDLTYSSSFNGEHATTIAGNGKDPGMADLLAVADYAGLSPRWAQATAVEIRKMTAPLLPR